ncbi:MAG: hypothetical protein SF028_07530 [Candidatus Sumerlaeia bacterium]|nr:hypothetical protein [Candidatus Sumerlaeia bacterium]
MNIRWREGGEPTRFRGLSSWCAIVPGEEEQLPAIACRVVVRALFSSGLAFQSPVLNFHDLQLMTYLNATVGTYVTRELVATQPIASAKVYAEMSVPSGTTVAWFASNDGGATWEPMGQEDARPLNDTWTEFVFSRTFASPAGNRVRFKAVMAGTALVTPRIHSLGATLA